MTQSYSNFGGSGDRRTQINVWSELGTTTGDSQISNTTAWNVVLDNSNTATSGPQFTTGHAVSGKTVLQFDFHSEPRVIDEVTIHMVTSSAGEAMKWQGSNDNATWDDLTGSVSFDVVTSPLVHALTNSTAYRHYRLLGISGNVTTSKFGEFLFSIDDVVTEGVLHASATGTWNNTLTKAVAITTTADAWLVALIDGNARAPQAGSIAVTGITDDQGNTWTKRTSYKDTANGIFGVSASEILEIWYARATTPGTITVTVTSAAAIDAGNVNLMAINNLADMTTLWHPDVSSTAHGARVSTSATPALNMQDFDGSGLVILMMGASYTGNVLTSDFGYDHRGLELFRSRMSGANNNGIANHSLFLESDPSTQAFDFRGTAVQTLHLSDVINIGEGSGGPSPDGDADGALLTATMSMIPGNTSDATPAGTTSVVTASLLAGSAAFVTEVDGVLLPAVVVSLAKTGVASTSAIDGGEIYEFSPSQSSATIYQEVNYDSIWSRGNRIDNGLITTGEYGWSGVGAAAETAFDNQFAVGLGNGPSQSGSTPGSSFWFHFGEDQLIDLRGIRSIGAEQHDDYEPMWSLFGGVAVGNLSPSPYTAGFDGFNITSVDAYPGTNLTTVYANDVLFEPRVYVAYPHYELILLGGTRTDSRLCNEFWLKVAHSNLDGGDRRPSASASRRVAFSMSADWVGSTIDSTYDTPQLALFDGKYDIDTGNKLGAIGATSNINNGVSTVGAWLQFTFPRPVSPKHLMFVNSSTAKESYTGDDPDKFGIWHWEYSNGGAFTAAGDPWSFREDCTWMVAPKRGLFGLPPVGTDGNGATSWRMVLDQGPALGKTQSSFVQILFDLDDVTGQAPPLEITFTDDTDGIPAVATIGSPGNPYTIAFSDGSDDGFKQLTLTNTPNPVLTVTFNDEGIFDTWSDLYPSTVVQTILVSTGKG